MRAFRVSPNTINRLKSRWLLLLAILTGLAVLDSFHDYLASVAAGLAVTLPDELKMELYYWGPCLALIPVVIALTHRYPLAMRPGRLSLHAVCALLFTYLNVLIQAIPRQDFEGPRQYFGRFFFLLSFEFALFFVFYALVVISVSTLQQYEDLRERGIRESQLEIALAETRLRAIQAQLNPHFFFNTLQAVAVLVMSGERKGVVDVLGHLSSLLRVSFDKHRPQQISLAAEMEFVDRYLAIHQLCFGQQLTIQRHISPETLSATVPTMLLQPFIENAIVHGIAVKPGSGLIHIAANRAGDDLLIEIADSGPGFQSSPPHRIGVGLSASESRLKLLFGSGYSLDYGRSEFGGASVRIRIPFVTGRAQAVLHSEGVAA